MPRHEKLTVPVSYFFVLMITLLLWRHIRDKIWCKKYKGVSNKSCKLYGTIDLSFKLKLKLIVFSFHNFTHREIKLFRHDKFFLLYRYVDKLKITMTISFAKLPYNIFKACLNLMC